MLLVTSPATIVRLFSNLNRFCASLWALWLWGFIP